MEHNASERDIQEKMRNYLPFFQVDQVGQLHLKGLVDPAVEKDRVRGNK